MSSDPEKPIEGLLRRYARKRRERAGEPWTVHPVTRRLWQEEVARQFPKKRPFGSRLLEFLRPGWLKPVLAVAAASAVIVVGFILIGPNGRTDGRTDKSTTDVASSRSAKVLATDQPTSQLATASDTDHSNRFFAIADNSPTPSRDRAMREALRSPSPAQNVPLQEKQEAVQAATPAMTLAENKKDQAVSAPAPASIAQDSVASAAPAAAAGVSSSLAASPQNEPKPSQSPGSAGHTQPGDVASFARAESDLALGMTAPAKAVQYGLFNSSQTPLVAQPQEKEALARRVEVHSALAARPESGNAQRVLTSFNLEQAGQELRVIDSDGSVYAGLMQSTNTLAGTLNEESRGFDAQTVSRQAVQSRRYAGQESEAPPAGSSFQLTGTNKTLNRRVVFAGVLTTNQAAANQAFVAGKLLTQSPHGLSGAADGSQTNQNVQALHLSGTAEIEGELPVRIEASPVSK